MRAARMVLVLMLLAAVTSAAEAQLLPRRRVAVRVGEVMADFGGRLTMEAMNQGLNQAPDELGEDLRGKRGVLLDDEVKRGASSSST